MKVVILAGGLGTRISEETHLKPKPMIEIGGKPILWHIMKVYSAHGVNEFVICCGYKGYVVKRIRGPTGNRTEQVWPPGGASKGVLFALFMQRAGAKVDMVIDINPAKHGKFLAATGLRVWSPDEAMRRLTSGATVFVMNGNYLNEIRELTADRFKYVLVEHDGV